MAMNAREQKELIAELESLGFRWEETKKNHIKAVSPDGKTFTFSTGGTVRSTLNQRAMLKRWKRENPPPQEEEVEVPQMNNDENGMIILEQMEPGVPFVAHDVANKTDLTKEEANNAITYLVAMGMLDLVERETGYSYLIPEEPQKEEEVALSPAAIAALEAMVEAVRNELEVDSEDYKTANDALRSELEKTKRALDSCEKRNVGLEKEVERLRVVENKFNEFKKLASS